MRIFTICLVTLLAAPVAFAGGPERIDVSPGVMMNLGTGHSGSFMGGAVTGDLFFTKSFALRATIGYTKDRYYPSDMDYSNSDHGFWLSIAPYAQLNFGNRVMPYVALLGTFSGGSNQRHDVQPIGMETAPYSRIQQESRNNSAWSLGASLGTKVRLTGPVQMYAEVSHYFYSSINRDEVYFGPGNDLIGRNFDFEHNPTYLTVGLSYSLSLR